MSQEFRVVKRTEIGLPNNVTSSDGSPRPPLSDCEWMTIHYTGVDAYWGDVGDTPQEIIALQNYAVYAKKPFEYNYVIGQDPDDLIYEYAGTFRAAHSAGENSRAVGVLVMNGVQEKMTDIQVRKVQWLRMILQSFRTLRADAVTMPHKNMPGAATACPGALILMRWPEILEPYSPAEHPVDPPPVEPPENSNMEHIKHGLHFVMPSQSPWGLSAMYYGTGKEWKSIVDANAPDPVPNPGERWIIPGFAGVDIEVPYGVGPWTIIKLAGQTPSKDAVARFYEWNGGPERWDPTNDFAIQPGDRVFVQYD